MDKETKKLRLKEALEIHIKRAAKPNEIANSSTDALLLIKILEDRVDELESVLNDMVPILTEINSTLGELAKIPK